MDELQRFVEALRAGRRREAYEAAREAWRVRRAPELAALVDRAAQLFTASPPAPTGKTQKAWADAWLALARGRAPHESAWLLAQLDVMARAHRSSLVAACLDELVQGADDPSLTLPACALAGVPGGATTFGSWGKVLTRLFAIIERTGDARAIAALEALAADAAADPEVRGRATSATLGERIPKTIAKLRKRLTDNGPLEAGVAAEVRAATCAVS